MHSPLTLEIFFAQYMPAMKRVIEDYWVNNREELVLFLNDCLCSGIMDGWMASYFQDMLTRAKTAPHTYTDPWTVL